MAVIEVDYRQVLAALRQLQQLTGDLSPAFHEIGEDLMASTKKRFVTYTGPDGVMWLANTDVTYERKADRSGIPLTDHGALGDSFHKEVSPTMLEIVNSMEYAAMMQFGGTKAEFPHLWGDIPARPFMGLSDEDTADVLTVLKRHINEALHAV